MHELLTEGMRIVHAKRSMKLIRFIEKWHGEYVWFVEEFDGRQHIEVFGLDDYIELYKEAA